MNRKSTANLLNCMRKLSDKKRLTKNNAEKKASKEIEVTEKRDLLMKVDEKIITLQSEITDYFSNLNSVVEKRI